MKAQKEAKIVNDFTSYKLG
ncbi:Protein of unknown function [Lactobacillus delbrueckii subsp. lactis]|nr:Protein of unknown function [Lactobacillus delbrueckii subsp. lactis]